jgi:tRNA threonylcarbamoyladenosine biosynthesis protein TsaB
LRSDPLILSFDTSAAHCAAALLSGDNVIAARHDAMKKGQAERLMPMVQDVLNGAGVTPMDLNAIAVGIGPGNFTGVRISVSAARGMALALKVPAIGVSLLEVLAFGIPGSVLACLTAPRDSAYVQLFGPHHSDPVHAALASLPRDLASPDTICVGSAAKDAADALGLKFEPAHFAPALTIARIAATRLDREHPAPAPLYLRPANAAPSRDKPPVLIDE